MNILAFPRTAVAHLIREQRVPFLFENLPEKAVFRPRQELEDDPNYVQLIAYAVLRNTAGLIWAYRRKGGDTRLDGRCSVGVGGHVDETDYSDDLLTTARNSLRRELNEELVVAPHSIPENPVAWINEQESPVGRVHIGLVWEIDWGFATVPQPQQGEALESIGFVHPSKITIHRNYELWSQLAALGRDRDGLV